MAILPMIDLAAPAWVSPLTRRVVTLDSLSNAAPALVETDEPTAGAEVLQLEEAGEVLTWLEQARWLACMEDDLHCVAKDPAGRSILTTCLDFVAFAEPVADAQGSAIGARLKRAHRAWTGAGADLVHFNFYALEEEAAALID